VEMTKLYPSDQTITVTISLEDPGEAYPAIARCMATIDGRSPQEHEHFFEHRFWRVQFSDDANTLDEDCEGMILLRSLTFRSHTGTNFKQMMWGSVENAEEVPVGLDTDGDLLADVTVPALFAVPIDKAWISTDLLAVPASKQK
ncbi:unnamed protein product, partial [Polarella glacialis]